MKAIVRLVSTLSLKILRADLQLLEFKLALVTHPKQSEFAAAIDYVFFYQLDASLHSRDTVEKQFCLCYPICTVAYIVSEVW